MRGCLGLGMRSTPFFAICCHMLPDSKAMRDGISRMINIALA